MKYYPTPRIPIPVVFNPGFNYCPGCGRHPSVHALHWAKDLDPNSCFFHQFGVATRCTTGGMVYFYTMPTMQTILSEYLAFYQFTRCMSSYGFPVETGGRKG